MASGTKIDTTASKRQPLAQEIQNVRWDREKLGVKVPTVAFGIQGIKCKVK